MGKDLQPYRPPKMKWTHRPQLNSGQNWSYYHAPNKKQKARRAPRVTWRYDPEVAKNSAKKFKAGVRKVGHGAFTGASLSTRFFHNFSMFLVILCLWGCVTGASFKSYKFAVRSLYQVTEKVGSVVQTVSNTVMDIILSETYDGYLYLKVDLKPNQGEYKFLVSHSRGGLFGLFDIYTVVSPPLEYSDLKGCQFRKDLLSDYYVLLGSSTFHPEFISVHGRFEKIEE